MRETFGDQVGLSQKKRFELSSMRLLVLLDLIKLQVGVSLSLVFNTSKVQMLVIE